MPGTFFQTWVPVVRPHYHHFERDCTAPPAIGAGNTSTKTCYKCQQPGHVRLAPWSSFLISLSPPCRLPEIAQKTLQLKYKARSRFQSKKSYVSPNHLKVSFVPTLIFSCPVPSQKHPMYLSPSRNFVTCEVQG